MSYITLATLREAPSNTQLGMATERVRQKPTHGHTHGTRPNPLTATPAVEKSHPRPHPPDFGWVSGHPWV
jgi:hypothetical protein